MVDHESGCVVFIGFIIAVAAGIFFARFGWGLGGESVFGSIIYAVLGFIIGMFLFGIIAEFLVTFPSRMKMKRENASRREAAEQKYESDCRKYEMECKAYGKEAKINSRMQKIISETIEENKATLARIKETLEKLYGLGIIYPTFQNTIAVHQIRQYLEMGLCDALEGSTGAYAEYMKDVRAQRICDSIQDMKNAVLDVLKQIAANQQLLYREIRQVSENITSLQSSMGDGLQAIQGEIQKIRDGLSQAKDNTRESDDAVNKQLEEMRRIMLTSAQNQYIVQREQLANDWWNRWQLQQP